MELNEFYRLVGGDYNEVIGRLPTENMIRKYLGKFSNSSDYADMMSAIKEQRWEDAFRGAHNIKGVSMNLGFGILRDSSSELCEALRGGAPSVDISEMVEKVSADYENVIGAIAGL